MLGLRLMAKKGLDAYEIVSKGDFESLIKIEDINRYVLEQEPVHGWTLLMIAAYHNHFEIAKYLIQKGSEINAKNYKGTSVIMYAKNGMLETGDDRLFKYLLHLGANPYQKDYSGNNLFYYIDEEIKEKIINL